MTAARGPDRFSPNVSSKVLNGTTTPFKVPDGDAQDIQFEESEINVQEAMRSVEDLNKTRPATATGPAANEDQLYESCLMVIRSFCQLPSMFWGAHLIRTEEQIKPVATAFAHYCKRKGIDPLDYFFDELPLIISAGTLVIGMKRDHQAWKEKEEKKKEEEKGAEYEI